MCPQDAWTPKSQYVHTCPEHDVKLLPCTTFDVGERSLQGQGRRGAQWWCTYVLSKTINCSHGFQLQDSGPGSTKKQTQTMKELDYVEKKEKLPIGPCCDRQGLLHLFMFLDAMMFIKKLIAMGRVVCFLRTTQK